MEANVYGVEVPVARPVLTEAEAALVVQVFENLFVFGMGRHPDELDSAGEVLAVAGSLCKKAAEIHRGLQVPWTSMCWAARLPAVTKEILNTQAVLERLLGVLHVDMVKQERPVRGCAMPNFLPAKLDD